MTKLATALALLAFATAQEEPKPRVNAPSIDFAPSGWNNCKWVSSGGPRGEQCYETRWTDNQGVEHGYLAALIDYPPGGTSCQGMFITRLINDDQLKLEFRLEIFVNGYDLSLVVPFSEGNCTGDRGQSVTSSTCWNISEYRSVKLDCHDPGNAPAPVDNGY